MPKSIALLSCSLLLGFTLLAADADAELKSQQGLFDKALAERDAKAMESLLADSYLLITRNGATNTKSQFLERLRAGNTPQGEGIELVQMNVYGNTGVVTRTRRQKSDRGVITVIGTSVWIKGPAGWKLVLAQNTAKEPQ